VHVVECVGIIPVPQFCFVLERNWFEEKSLSFMNSNNPLAVEPETENDAALENCLVRLSDFHARLQRRLSLQR
jgi:hypothetical protein